MSKKIINVLSSFSWHILPLGRVRRLQPDGAQHEVPAVLPGVPHQVLRQCARGAVREGAQALPGEEGHVGGGGGDDVLERSAAARRGLQRGVHARQDDSSQDY